MNPRRDDGLQPFLLIVCGLPHSGKSAISRALADELDGAVHIDIDAINAERGFGKNEPAPMTEWATTYQLAYDRAVASLGDGLSVIIDAGSYSRAQRDILRQKARSAGAESAVAYIAVAEEACRARWRDSEHPMDEFMFERAVERFEAPEAEERVIVYLPGMSARDLASGVRQAFAR